MSIDRQHGKVLFECDWCGDVFSGAAGEDFKAVYARAKEEGWSAKKIEGKDLWKHKCKDCSNGNV